MRELFPFQQRVVRERDKLSLKIDKLSAFIESEAFWDISEDEQKRLLLQVSLMACYRGVLTDRIFAFLEAQ